jgi:hypothetical protein
LKSPFETPEFRALLGKWNQILARDGLAEITDQGDFLSGRHYRDKSTPADIRQRIELTQSYYERASELLKDFAFKTKLHRRIWELHCEGLSIRNIVKKLRKHRLSKTKAHLILTEIESTARIKRRG